MRSSSNFEGKGMMCNRIICWPFIAQYYGIMQFRRHCILKIHGFVVFDNETRCQSSTYVLPNENVYLNIFWYFADKLKGRETVDTKVDHKIEWMKELHRFYSPLVLYSFDSNAKVTKSAQVFPIDSLFAPVCSFQLWCQSNSSIDLAYH